MNEFYGESLEIKEDVKYIGAGKNPAKDPFFILWVNALKKIYRPERLNPEAPCNGDAIV